MSLARILNVDVVEPEAPFLAPYQFKITFECISPLDAGMVAPAAGRRSPVPSSPVYLEFKLIYVGSAKTKTLDQELDSLLVGPVPMGINMFLFEADAPVPSKIPKEDLMGVTIILLTCSYKGRMFERIGYYVDNAYTDEALLANPPESPVPEKLFRSILADKPRVTRYPINWEDPTKEEQPPVQLGDIEDADDDFHVTPVGGKDDEEDEGFDEEEDEDEEDGDDKGEVDLDMTEEQDEAELMSAEGEDDDESGDEEREDEGHGGDAMAVEDELPKTAMRAAAADPSAMDIE
ncbi:Histone chaperone asf1 [Coemansia helicoidea]|uniref:Histone chaperone asf1 n=1 Tax=Coemansia helicoidea TaxID=1286919 RepID=A0ACC1L093_9FUNG|nr:Histone chaperone asf1 [Coemansia helicoidea]